MIGRTNAAGGAGLNFKVVGGTTNPGNPKENTIWVKTDTRITGWDFSHSAPRIRSGTKNLIPYPYDDTTQTENGVTFTDNGDGTITANGTAKTAAYFTCMDASPSRAIALEPGTYTLSGGTTDPAGGKNYASVGIRCSADGFATNVASHDAKASPVTFTINQPVLARFFIVVPASGTLTNAVIKPQLEKGSEATSFLKGDVTGRVWVEIGDAAPVSFNALKKDNIEVRPVSVRQPVNGEWVRREWAIYQSGAWEEFGAKLYLSNGGDKCVDVSGGWERKTYSDNPGDTTWVGDGLAFTCTTATILARPSGFDESLIGQYSTLNAEFEITKITDNSNPFFALGLAKNYTFTTDVGSQWLARANATTLGTHIVSVPLDGFDTGKPMIGAYHIHGKMRAVWLE